MRAAGVHMYVKRRSVGRLNLRTAFGPMRPAAHVLFDVRTPDAEGAMIVDVQIRALGGERGGLHGRGDGGEAVLAGGGLVEFLFGGLDRAPIGRELLHTALSLCMFR